MKITIEPTEAESVNYPAICITRQGDDLNLDETLALLLAALQAWGFSYVRDLEADLGNIADA